MSVLKFWVMLWGVLGFFCFLLLYREDGIDLLFLKVNLIVFIGWVILSFFILFSGSIGGLYVFEWIMLFIME